MATILCVDDDASALAVLRDTLDRAGHHTHVTAEVASALTLLDQGGIDLIISDYRMPGTSGLELLEQLRADGNDVPLVMITGYGSIEHAVASIKAGAIDYVTKPIRAQQLQLVVDQALEFARLRRENATLREQVQQLRTNRTIIGESPALQRIMQTVNMVAPTRAAVLLEGESGTGKELLARAIHDLSDRRDGPFVSINCAAMPDTLVESTLFGHEKGAFTGAIRQVKGAFERAHRGTLLLDEISEMRLDLQAKLLRVLQEQEFERVGGTHAVRVDVRIIATTNRDLHSQVDSGDFREDLFYRLSVMPIRVPSLKERSGDIPLLAHHFARRVAKELNKPFTGFAPETLEYLESQPWPGNVRELAHTVERAMILSRSDVLTPANFDPALTGRRNGARQHSNSIPAAGPPLMSNGKLHLESLNIAEAERLLIEKALVETRQNRTRAADLLGISVRTLRNKLNRPEEGALEVEEG